MQFSPIDSPHLLDEFTSMRLMDKFTNLHLPAIIHQTS